MRKGIWLIMTVLSVNKPAAAAVSVDVFSTANHQKIGVVSLSETDSGLRFNVNLHGLPPGEHGFHIHENPDCGAAKDKNGIMQAALKAGGHFDPDKTGKHRGPDGHGHRGDLPALNVDNEGKVKTIFTLKDLSLEEVLNRSLIIHAGGDNYSDSPLPLGGGGARIACGVIKEN